MADGTSNLHGLQLLDQNSAHEFKKPVKCINDGDDVSFFLASQAYTDIMTFIFQLNAAVIPRKLELDGKSSIQHWNLQDSTATYPPVIHQLVSLLDALNSIIDEVPPDPGPRRFGNISFRRWYELVDERLPALLDEHLPTEVLDTKSGSDVSPKTELQAYLSGSFGSAQRLDYGTGHELSFLAFLGGLWKLGAFPPLDDGATERAVVLGVFEPYLRLIRRLILTYTLEPAGSHGVWGLDDHSFLPYVFGSAQYMPAITSPSEIATEGSCINAPNPADVAKAAAVDRERRDNMYFSAIGFINDVKKGPFWEHSPILFDISGVKAGWAKINKGMLKMYNAEVLSKFPVVQHFPFGSLFAWEKDPAAKEIQASVHTSSQPKVPAATQRPQAPLRDPLADTYSMPGRGGVNAMPSSTAAPWASSRMPSTRPGVPVPSGANQPTKAPWASKTPLPPQAGVTTAAPWAKSGGSTAPSATRTSNMPSTQAPWAEKGPQT